MTKVVWLVFIGIAAGILAINLGTGGINPGALRGVSADPLTEPIAPPTSEPISSGSVQQPDTTSVSMTSQVVVTQQMATNPPALVQTQTPTPDPNTHSFRVCGTADDAEIARQIEAYASGKQFKVSLVSNGGCATLSITSLGPAVVNQNSQTNKVNATSSTRLSVSTTAQGDSPAKRINVEISSRNGIVTVAINSVSTTGVSVPEGNSHEAWEQWLDDFLKETTPNK